MYKIYNIKIKECTTLEYKYYSLDFNDFNLSLGYHEPDIADIIEILDDALYHNGALKYQLQTYKIDLIRKKVMIEVVFYYEKA